jgi:F-type H+-transporting ATPase subunit a
VTTLTTLAAAEWGGDFSSAFEDVVHLFDMPDIWGSGPLAINRTALIMLFMTLVAMALFWVAFRKPSATKPNKFQLLMEAIVGFVRDQIALEIIGPRGLAFVPILTTFFVFIFFLNFAKLTPFIMLPPTSRLAVTLFLAFVSWCIYVGVGLREHGLGYFKAIVVPPGVPLVIVPLIGLLELVSTLVLRPFTLAVRLFANMVAGHILVVITLVLIHVFLPSWPAGTFLGISGLVLAPIVFAFEFFIVALQAYIFTMLTAVYIQSSMETH